VNTPRLRAIVIIAWLAAASAASAQSFFGTLPDERRIVRLEAWLHAVYEHEAGAPDHAVTSIARWSGSDLEKLFLDSDVLAQLMRNSKLGRFTVKAAPPQPALEIRYTRAQLDRMRLLATALECGTAGTNAACLSVTRLAAEDDGLKRLLTAVQAEPPADGDNGVLKRAAMLHTDIVIMVPASARGVDDRPLSASTVRIEFNDGQQRALTVGPVHWAIARALLDHVKPVGAEKPAPERDMMVRRWYHATSAWLQANMEYEPDHLDRGRRIFPDDALLQFYSGTFHEAMAAPEVQTMVRGVALPTGVTVAVKSERAELRAAEGFFRRSVELDPQHVEARLRFGHVLLGQERYADAATELRKVVDQSGEPLIQFYASMFLGAAEEGLGRTADAVQSYERAATLYPTSQSPRVALSALARRTGNRQGAWTAMQQVFALPPTEPDRDDPWWSYIRQQGRDAEEQIEELRQLFDARAER